jgi:hypothetical protein
MFLKTVKRKRGKLNLEKAMSKNIFEENGRNSNSQLLDQVKLNNEKNIISTINECDEILSYLDDVKPKMKKKSISSVKFELVTEDVDDQENKDSSSFQNTKSRLSTKLKPCDTGLKEKKSDDASNGLLSLNTETKAKQDIDDKNSFPILDEQLDQAMVQSIQLKNKINFI